MTDREIYMVFQNIKNLVKLKSEEDKDILEFYNGLIVLDYKNKAIRFFDELDGEVCVLDFKLLKRLFNKGGDKDE